METGKELIDRRRSCVVLVTGASGFLGQHVIGLLQTRADHVTNIRVLDLVEYVNKLDYDAPKPVEQYVGSINDLNLVTRACKDVDCVMHVAGLIDSRMFPNRKLLEQVNVGGTATVIQACRKQGVKRLIYCSTMEVVVGYDDIISGTEETSQKPAKFALKDYAETKCRADEMILRANDPHLTTVAIRPSSIYGELDRLGVTRNLQIAKQIGCYLEFNTNAVLQRSYAGNVAWAFVCAERKLSESSIKKLHLENKIGGNAFFVCDETPVTSFTEFTKSFLDPLEMKSFCFKIPINPAIFVMYIMFYVMIVIRLVLDVNCLLGPNVLKVMNTNVSFKYDKAKKFLGYKPIYTYAEAHERSIVYYKKLAESS